MEKSALKIIKIKKPMDLGFSRDQNHRSELNHDKMIHYHVLVFFFFIHYHLMVAKPWYEHVI